MDTHAHTHTGQRCEVCCRRAAQSSGFRLSVTLRVDVRFNHLVVPPSGESPDISLILTRKSGGTGVTVSELEPKEFSDNNDPITVQRRHVTVRVTCECGRKQESGGINQELQVCPLQKVGETKLTDS